MSDPELALLVIIRPRPSGSVVAAPPPGPIAKDMRPLERCRPTIAKLAMAAGAATSEPVTDAVPVIIPVASGSIAIPVDVVSAKRSPVPPPSTEAADACRISMRADAGRTDLRRVDWTIVEPSRRARETGMTPRSVRTFSEGSVESSASDPRMLMKSGMM